MAERPLFHIRKALNTLHRSAFAAHHPRSYSAPSTSTATDDISTTYVQTPQQARTHAEKILYLRALDQKLLQETHTQCSTLIAHIRTTTATISALPTTIPQREGDTVTYPTYTVSALRQNASRATATADAVIAATEHVQAHLDDLRRPDIYGAPLSPSSSGSGTSSTSAEWAREIAGWSLEERERELEGMRIEEIAEVTRLKSSVEGLGRKIREMEAMGGKGVERVRTGSPFAREREDRKEGRDREKGRGWGETKEDKKAKDGKDDGGVVEEKKAPAPALSLAERMARMQGKA